MSDVLLKIKNVSKKFFIRRSSPEQKERNLLARGVNYLNKRAKITDEEFYALKEISFDLHRGDIIGIIGENGAGKSTLLKIIGEVFPPSGGEIEYFGKMASVLEAGSGFHPDLSGRENIFLSGSMIGLSKREIHSHFDEIVDFSGVGKFIDTPVKHYSAGMYVRLAFSIISHLNADILLIDEIISVGDAEFRMKSLKKIKEKISSGTSFLIVSHNLNEISNLCNKCIVLKNGTISDFGDSVKITREYYQKMVVKHLNSINRPLNLVGRKYYAGEAGPGDETSKSNPRQEFERLNASALFSEYAKIASGNDELNLLGVSAGAKNKPPAGAIQYDDAIEITIDFEKRYESGNLAIAIELLDQLDSPVFIASTENSISEYEYTDKSRYLSTVTIPPRLLNYGMFAVNIIFAERGDKVIAKFRKILFFYVSPENDRSGRMSNLYTPGPLRPMLEWTMKKRNTEKP